MQKALVEDIGKHTTKQLQDTCNSFFFHPIPHLKQNPFLIPFPPSQQQKKMVRKAP